MCIIHVSRSATIEIHFIYRDRMNHSNFEGKNSVSRCEGRTWGGDAERPTLFHLAAVAQTVSKLEPMYHVLKSQCIWYAMTVFHMVSPVRENEVFPVIFKGLEAFLITFSSPPPTAGFARMLEEIVAQQNTATSSGTNHPPPFHV